MTGEQHAPRLVRDFVAHPLRRILGMESAHHPELRHWVARAQEALGSLARAQLAAVPDHVGLDAVIARRAGERGRMRQAARRERPLRIDLGADGVGVMNQHELHFC